MAGCVFLALFAVPFFALLETRSPVWIVLAISVGLALGHGALYSVQAALIPELFATRLRCTAASIGYQLGAPLAGGLAPIIAVITSGGTATANVVVFPAPAGAVITVTRSREATRRTTAAR
jgi:MFS family permease